MSRGNRRALGVLVLFVTLASAGCGGKEYEYEEELYLDTDGSATLNVNASIASLVALHGAQLDASPAARPNRERVRALFAASGIDVEPPTFFRRDGRRFVHVTITADTVSDLSRVAPLAWSTYRFSRSDGALVFTQTVGRARTQANGDRAWTGNEIVAFRLHAPSKVLVQNATSGLQRGNILAWEQPLSDRLAGVPLQLRVEMESTSILSSTLLLFGATVILVVMGFAFVIWWVARRGAALSPVGPSTGGPTASDPRRGSSDGGFTSST